jgi:PAS domain S-box-containing protein
MDVATSRGRFGKFRLVRPLSRYAFAVGAVAAALLLRLIILTLSGGVAPFVIFLDAVLVTTFVAGPGPALLCLALSIPIAMQLFAPVDGSPLHQAVFQIVLYIGGGFGVIALMSQAQRWERRAREAIDLAPDVYLLADRSGRLIDVNSAASELLGYSRDELLAMRVRDVIGPDDTTQLEADQSTLIAHGALRTSALALRRKDGSILPVEISANLLSDGRWQAFARDITERLRIRNEREEALERFRLTVDEAPIGMAMVALDGRFIRVNNVLCEITGYTPEELKKLTFQDITHPDDLAADVELARRLAAGEIPRYQFEKRYIRKDKSIVHVMLSVSVVRNPDGTARYYISQIEDITDRKRFEAALRRAIAARDTMLGVVAHDLRNPLGTILMAASLLERPGPDPERRNPEPRELIVRSARRMNRLIQDLLDVTLAEAGELKVETQRLSPRDIVREIVELQSPVASASHLVLETHVPDDLPDVRADHHRLLQVFENLIGNAIKFTAAGGRITVAAGAATDEGTPVVRFSVTDTGAGMPPEDLARVFDRFWQGGGEERRLGAGLGLPISRGIVLAHGGRIWAESEVGRGTTFFFTIPVATSGEAQSSVLALSPTAPQPSPRRG